MHCTCSGDSFSLLVTSQLGVAVPRPTPHISRPCLGSYNPRFRDPGRTKTLRTYEIQDLDCALVCDNSFINLCEVKKMVNPKITLYVDTVSPFAYEAYWLLRVSSTYIILEIGIEVWRLRQDMAVAVGVEAGRESKRHADALLERPCVSTLRDHLYPDLSRRTDESLRECGPD